MKATVIIIGGGLVGAHLARVLGLRGYTVKVYEKRPDMRTASISAGRSINLALSDRGWKALDAVGTGQRVRQAAIPMRGRMIHPIDGEIRFQPYGLEGQAIYSVSRGGLNRLLLDAAEELPNVELFFQWRCIDVDLDRPAAVLENVQTGEQQTVAGDYLVGADGAFSAVRYRMQRLDRFQYSQYYIEHGYKELSIPPAEGGGWRIEPNALHIWPRRQFMLIALPNQDGSFTCTLFLPFEGSLSFEQLSTPQKVRQFFEKHFPDAVSLMPTLQEDFFQNPTSSLAIIRCYPWSYKGKVMLIGDAAHAIVPFYGQGVNAGFEDCRVFAELLEQYQDDWATVLPIYQQMRKPNADAIADLAMRNFLEMRDHVADPRFLLRKAIERRLTQEFPDRFLPVYSMVTFSPDVPYRLALEEQQKQDRMFEEILQVPGIEHTWETSTGWEKILAIFDRYYPDSKMSSSIPNG